MDFFAVFLVVVAGLAVIFALVTLGYHVAALVLARRSADDQWRDGRVQTSRYLVVLWLAVALLSVLVLDVLNLWWAL